LEDLAYPLVEKV